jgi:hypothetical protein
MKRFLGIAVAMFFAMVAIALTGAESSAVAGHGCHGRARCHGRVHRCHGRERLQRLRVGRLCRGRLLGRRRDHGRHSDRSRSGRSGCPRGPGCSGQDLSRWNFPCCVRSALMCVTGEWPKETGLPERGARFFYGLSGHRACSRCIEPTRPAAAGGDVAAALARGWQPRRPSARRGVSPLPATRRPPDR